MGAGRVKIAKSGKSGLPGIVVGAAGTALLYSLVSDAASEEDDPVNDIADRRHRESMAHDIERTTRNRNLDEMRGATTAQLHSDLMRRGILPTTGGRAATATYLTESAARESAGGPLDFKGTV